jgi:hypothetical protein
MKKRIAICILSVLAIGMVLMSGCTDAELAGAATVAPTTPQVTLTELETPTPTPTLARPTKTTPNATVTITKTPTTKPTTSPTVTTMKTTVTVVTLAIDDTPGSISIFTQGSIGNDVTVYIARQGSNVLPLTHDQYHNLVVPSGYISINILPNGESPTVSLAPGYYIAYLPDKTGIQQPEQQSFTINPNCNTVVTFSGYSYRAASGGGCGG